MDPIIDLVRHAALNISGINDLPGCLKGATPRETIAKLHSLIKEAENHLRCEATWVQDRHPPQAGSSQEDYIAYLRPQAQQLAGTVPGNLRLNEIAKRHIPSVAEADALSILMRLWAGCLAAAKTVRENKVVAGGQTVALTSDERAASMRSIHTTAREDAIYDAAVPVGPYAKRQKPKPEPETVIYTGITAEFQRQYFLDDILQHPDSPGAINP